MIADLRTPMTLQEKILTADGAGGYSASWQNVASNPDVFVALQAATGREDVRGHKLAQRVTHRIVMRYRADVTTDMRLYDGERAYDIVSVLDRDGRKMFLEVLAVT